MKVRKRLKKLGEIYQKARKINHFNDPISIPESRLAHIYILQRGWRHFCDDLSIADHLADIAVLNAPRENRLF